MENSDYYEAVLNLLSMLSAECEKNKKRIGSLESKLKKCDDEKDKMRMQILDLYNINKSQANEISRFHKSIDSSNLILQNDINYVG